MGHVRFPFNSVERVTAIRKPRWGDVPSGLFLFPRVVIITRFEPGAFAIIHGFDGFVKVAITVNSFG